MPLKLERLWIAPALFGGLALAMLVNVPPHGMEWLWLFIALAIGGVTGWYRGRMMRISVDPATHKLNQAASPAAAVFILAIVIMRYGLRTLLADQAQAWHINPFLITDIFMLFVVGMIAMQRVEMAIRARRLLSEARAARG